MAHLTIGSFFVGGIQSTKRVLLEISLNFWRCCFWLCCASFSFCFGTIIQRFASGKMRILEAKCWNVSLDVFVFLMASARSGHDTGQSRMRKVGKRENVKSSVCRTFTLEIYVVISIGSMFQICCVVDSINSTLSARKGFGYLRKKLAEEAKQAIRAAVSWTGAIRELRRDEGRHWTNFHMNNRVWIAYCKQYFFYISRLFKW